MNRIAFFSDSAATTKEKAGARTPPDCSEDFEDSDDEESLPYLAGETTNGTQFSRLIDASCKAFFLRRGLDPDLDVSRYLKEPNQVRTNRPWPNKIAQ